MDEYLAEEGELSFGGCYWRRGVQIVNLGPCRTSASTLLEQAIRSVAGGRLVVYMDSSRDDRGRVGGGWYADGNGAGSVAVCNV